MKKIISMGIASAVLALTAIAASAAVTPQGPETLTVGDTAVFTIVTTADMVDTQFNVKVSGLEYKSATTTEKGLSAWNAEAGGFVCTGDYKANDVLLTLTYTVTAAEGESVSFQIEASDAAYADQVDATAVTYSAAAGTTTPTPDDGGSKPADTTNPDTGVALAVVPAVLAGAAVVVAKKRK